jgi:integrase
LDDGGIVSHLSACTLEDLTRRYAYFLSFLAKQEKLNAHGLAAASVTEKDILHYVRYLEPHVSSVTLAQSIYKISRVAACLSPEQDWRWLKRVARRLDLRAKPRDKRHEVVEIRALFELGLQLMDEAEEADTSDLLRRALLYRDGLIIALLAAAPLRRANIAGLEIGKTLVLDGTTWSLEIPAEETKERRLHVAVLPDWTGPCIDRYVHHYRPLFPAAETTSSGSSAAVGRLARTGSTASSANGRVWPSASGSIYICFGLAL